jgi:hypothetical protein
METPHQIELTLRVTGGPLPIEGSVLDGSGHPSAFRGWLELVAVLERARSCVAERATAIDRGDLCPD